MNIKDLDWSVYSIKTPAEHQEFRKNVSNVFSQIEQNYDDSKELLVNFVLLMEKVYAEHPDIEKIGIEVDQESSVEDARNNMYIHGMDFTLVNADTQQPLSGEAVRKVSEYIQDSYADKAYSEGTYEAGNMTLAVMETDLYFHDFAHTSRDNRFSLYRGMIDYNYIHNKESLDSFVDAVEKGKPIEDRYKTVNLLGEDVKIKTMGISDGFLSKDATSRDVESLKKQLINIESAYVINNIKEAVLRSNLDAEDKLDISFNAKSPNNYSGYICCIEDVNKNRLDVNVDLAFPKWFGFDKSSTIVRPKEDLGEALSRKFTDYSSTENLNKKVDKNAEDIERNYTDVNDFIKQQRPRMKM